MEKQKENIQQIVKYLRDDELNEVLSTLCQNYNDFVSEKQFKTLEHSIYKVIINHHQKDNIHEIVDMYHIGTIIYHYMRGSHAYGLATETSDEDFGGVYIIDNDYLMDMGFDYQEQINNETNDICFYEIKKFLTLLATKTNPTTLESLFIPERCILYEHPIMTDLKSHRDEFLTKQCFPALYGYAKQQRHLAQTTKKKAYSPVTKRLGLLDFVYTFHKQGSSKIENWLEYRNLQQKYIGLVKVANMEDNYAAFYDWGMFFQNEGISCEDIIKAYRNPETYDIIRIVKDYKAAVEEGTDHEKINSLHSLLRKAQFQNMVRFIVSHYRLDPYGDTTEFELANWYVDQKPIGYKGIVKEGDRESTEARLSSVEKDAMPICHISYNDNAYSQHCREYNEYQQWNRNKNAGRWAKVVEGKRGYDAKNMSHACRLCRMAIELATDGQFIIDRTNIDRDYLLAVKHGEIDIDELFANMDKDFAKMEEAIKNSTIPETVDVAWVNTWVRDARKAINKEICA